MIKVGVLGAKGRMGTEACRTVEAAGDLELTATADAGDPLEPLTACDVVVDFTHPGVVLDNLRWCLAQGLNVVVGTSGFDGARLAAVTVWLGSTPSARVLIVPNFSIGAVLMMRFAEQAAPFFESAEVVELHHPAKADAPSRPGRADHRGGPREPAWGRRRTPPSRAPRLPAAPSSTTCTCTRSGWRAWSRTRRCCSAATARS